MYTVSRSLPETALLSVSTAHRFRDKSGTPDRHRQPPSRTELKILNTLPKTLPDNAFLWPHRDVLNNHPMVIQVTHDPSNPLQPLCVLQPTIYHLLDPEPGWPTLEIVRQAEQQAVEQANSHDIASHFRTQLRHQFPVRMLKHAAHPYDTPRKVHLSICKRSHIVLNRIRNTLPHPVNRDAWHSLSTLLSYLDPMPVSTFSPLLDASQTGQRRRQWICRFPLLASILFQTTANHHPSEPSPDLSWHNPEIQEAILRGRLDREVLSLITGYMQWSSSKFPLASLRAAASQPMKSLYRFNTALQQTMHPGINNRLLFSEHVRLVPPGTSLDPALLALRRKIRQLFPCTPPRTVEKQLCNLARKELQEIAADNAERYPPLFRAHVKRYRTPLRPTDLRIATLACHILDRLAAEHRHASRLCNELFKPTPSGIEPWHSLFQSTPSGPVRIRDWIRSVRRWSEQAAGATASALHEFASHQIDWISPDPIDTSDIDATPLLSQHDLSEESKRMNHCIASYTSQCLVTHKPLHAYHLQHGKLQSTLTIVEQQDKQRSPWSIDQILGHSNKAAPATHVAWARAFVECLNAGKTSYDPDAARSHRDASMRKLHPKRPDVQTIQRRQRTILLQHFPALSRLEPRS